MSFIKRLKHGSEAAAVQALLSGLSRFDLDTVSAMGARAGRLARRILPRRDALARENMLRALPGCDPEPLLDEMWQNLGRTFFELTKIREIERTAGAGILEVVGAERLHEAVAAGRGLVLISGHVANWETAALGVALQGVQPAIMFRAPTNTAVNGLLGQMRPKAATFLEKSRQGTTRAFAIVRDGGCAGFLMDHRYNKGVTVDFFGRPANIAPTAALMARKYRCPVIPVRPERIGEGARFRVTICPPLELDYDLPADDFAQTTIQQAMSALESWIRERPAHWFWVQRLWAD